MLQTLTIRNLALLESVSLEFDAGFTAVTGETGAGKSVLLGALSLLAGARVDKTVIRQREDACEVEAALWFKDTRRLDHLLEELDLPACEEGLLVVKRRLSRTRAPRISVNGSLTTLTALQRIGELWIDFHGPSEPRRLLKSSCQRELLDLYARNGKVRSVYDDRFSTWRELIEEKQQLIAQDRLSPDQIDFLTQQLAELDTLDLAAEAIEGLERDFNRISRAQEMQGLAMEIEEGLNGESGLGEQLAALLRSARELGELDEESRALADRLQTLGIELADVAGEYAALGGDLHFEPEEVETLSQRMDAWMDAKRKYGANPETVAQERENLRLRLAAQGDIEGTLAKLDQRIKTAETAAREAAGKLRQTRLKAAKSLAKTAGGSITQLGFKKADFVIKVVAQNELGPTGDCAVEFMFSPNVGEDVQPLNRIASSGELARVMLALKTVLAEIDAVPVLVFDEVDANVGGEIGRVVGEKMASIGRNHQVICVTHLPQVAAQGAGHLVVEKDQSKDRAVVTIRGIHEQAEDRVDELARMLGDRKASSARAHAAELLQAD